MDASLLAYLWACLIAFAILVYVLLDGFDLGVGVLFGTTRNDGHRSHMLASIAPVWDGNETWLVLVGASLFGAFPVVYAIFLSAFYLPVALLLFALIFRGIAFEFRNRATRMHGFWDWGFFLGSTIAAFVQGAAIGNLVQELPVTNGYFAGTSFDWVNPFGLFCGYGLVLVYSLLGATWLVLKTEGDLRRWAAARIPFLLVGTVIFFGACLAFVLVTEKDVLARWNERPWLTAFPVAGAVAALGLSLWGPQRRNDALPFVLAVIIVLAAFLTLGGSFWPYMVPYAVSIADAAAPPASLEFMFWAAGLVVFPVALVYTAIVYWVFRGKARQGDGYHGSPRPGSGGAPGGSGKSPALGREGSDWEGSRPALSPAPSGLGTTGPVGSDVADLPEKSGPSGGWGSMRGIARIYGETWPSPEAVASLERLNKPNGSMCASCAWPKPANYHPFEFCENGAKATLWEMTSARCRPEFWNDHTVGELRSWSDYALELTGRLTAPLRYDAAIDRYIEVDWDEAFTAIGTVLKSLPRKDVVFYSSGHAGLEAGYLWALTARLYGNNNLPQSSNMCHETTSVGLKQVIGSAVGTVLWEDLEATDCFFFFGQNPGTNSPRFLHPLKAAKDRGARIVTFNPVREQGLISFVDPQNLYEMATGHATIISDQYHQLKGGSDIAAILGLCKAVIEADDQAKAEGAKPVIDWAFIQEHTTGFEAFDALARRTPWSAIIDECGLTEQALRAAAQVYIEAERVIGVYGMGLTQQVRGCENIGMLVNLLSLRGNIGRLGAGVCPVRGHSNVQGQRTVGIAEKAALVPLDRLRELFGFEPPQEDGMHIVDAAQGILDGRVKAMLCLGGNLVRALPDSERLQDAWPKLELTVAISTKLNRTHLYPGKAAYILPCLSRSEIDEQETGNQYVSIEDSFSMVHGSIGKRPPPSEKLKSELAITVGIAKAAIEPNPKVVWDAWLADYSKVRDLIEATYPDDFRDFNRRMNEPGGFWRGNPAHERVWKTASGKVEITTPQALNAVGFADAPGRYRLMTMRSNDQFNTTIYGYSDRFRGIEGTRDVLLMNEDDMQDAGLSHGERVALIGDAADGVPRRLDGLRIVRFNLPRGTVGSYYPECNVLVSVDHRDRLSKTPASKAVPVRIERAA